MARRTTVTRRPAGQGPKDQPRSVSVRMYCDILGDCFLLGVPEGDRTRHILIDCGILQGMPGATEQANRIMADIKSVTTILDVLVVTHEHVDHLSGFEQAKSIFSDVTVSELWLAWTEDPRDEQAMRLRAGREKVKTLLAKSYTAFANYKSFMSHPGYSDDEDPSEAEGEPLEPGPLDELSNVLAFAGIGPDGPGVKSAASTTAILERLKLKAERVRYLTPGTKPELGFAADIGVYVLGPPRDEKLLRRSNPRKNHAEVYQLSGDVGEDYLLAASVMLEGEESSLDADDLQRLQMSLPFGLRAMIPLDNRLAEIGLRTDDAARATALSSYDDLANDWRKVDIDWLGATEALALKLDSDTNNTSLVLAFELGEGPHGRVLLFPGDAQIGSWLSWHDLIWPPGAQKGDIGSVNAADLLAKTVLYKVGHHASHNATPREFGLELMTHPDLVAMIPVEEAFANNSKHWKMPFRALLDRLMEKTGGRVIRADRAKADIKAYADDTLSSELQLDARRWQCFFDNLDEISDRQGLLALEYYIPYATS